MLGPKLLMFCFFCFITGHFIGLTLEGSWFDSADESVIHCLTGYNVTELSASGIMAIPKVFIGFFTTGFPKLILWDYPFLYGTFLLVRIILLGTISVGVVWGMCLVGYNLVYGVASRVLGW